MKKRSETPVSLKEILAGIFQDARIPFNPEDAHIWRVWDEVVGAAIARNAKPSWIKEGKLRVNVSNSVWLQELNFVQETIKEKLNGKLGRRAVNRIEFRLRSQ
ncbi:MAG: DUF721 domain-containing protein [Pseudomonadota bacterium]